MKRILVLVVTLGLAGCGDGSGGSGGPGEQAARAPVEKVPGQLTYQRFCFSCHASGSGGAPRTGHVEAWKERLAKGEDVLVQNTIDGIPPAMPPRGLCMQCSDEELAATVRFMLDLSR